MGTLAQAMEAPFRLGTGTHTELSKVIGVNNKEGGLHAPPSLAAAAASKQASSTYKAPILQDPDSQKALSTRGGLAFSSHVQCSHQVCDQVYRVAIISTLIHVHSHTAPGNLCSLFLNVVFHVPPSTPLGLNDFSTITSRPC